MAGVSITDELRKWVEGQDNDIKEDQCWILEPYVERKLLSELAAIADRIDKQYDQLQAKLDEYDRTQVELPRDANGEVFRIGCTVRMVERHPDVLLTVHRMTLCDDGEWFLCTWDDKEEYWCNLRTSEFEVCEKPQDSLGSIVHDLIMNNITESQAVERIEALNG